MLRTRHRRRFKILLISLLLVSLIAFFENRIEAFAPQFKSLAEARIEDAFNKKINISIGALEGGIVRPFILKDVKMLGKTGNISSDLVEIDSVVSNYRIWNFIFPKLLPKEPYAAVKFTAKNRKISGFFTIEGAIEGALLEGYLSLLSGDRIDFTGSIKNGIANLILKPNEGLIKAEANFAAEGVLLLKVIASHIKFHSFDIVGEAIVKNIAEGTVLEGEVEVKNIILDYKPFSDVKASYRISGETLEVSNLDFGRIFYLNGKFGLREPHIIDVQAVTDNVSLSQVLSMANPRYVSFLSGQMNSKWELKGPLDNLKSKVRLEVRNGSITEMNFQFLSANLKGDGPLVRIEDSRITRESGYFVLAGDIDMRKFGKDSLFEGIKITDAENALLWDAYDTAKWQDVREFRMKKKVSEDLNVGFKKFVADEKVDESIWEKDEYKLEYSLHPKDSLTMKYQYGKNFFGLEHKDKF
ncbi:MAG: hypothetical protein HZA72_03980 [Candidatus Omnitrophica bacterium]|nr:hypothetical protein [Candidatus Omnitrophota bacterium]